MKLFTIAVLSISFAAAEEVKKQPLAVTEQDKQSIRLAQLEVENIGLQMEILRGKFADLQKQQAAAQEKLVGNVERVKKTSGADGYELNIGSWTWIAKPKPASK